MYPPEHWQDVAKATRENLAAHRALRDQELAAECRTCAEGEKHRQQIQDQYKETERHMMQGCLLQIKMQ